MDAAQVIFALDSDARRKALQIVAKGPSNVQEVMDALNREGLSIKYRESVYRALELLVEAELVTKQYAKGKGICYQLCAKKITINLEKGNIE
jgi:Fe2+ or Zn2+ uptake regulation protein